MLEIVCGWDHREVMGFQVAQHSALRLSSELPRFVPLVERLLRREGLYTREHEQRDGQAWDVISAAPMSTAFANSRFLTPWLASGQWALYCDFADMLFLADPAELFDLADDRFAVQVVKREHVPATDRKMDGQAQVKYPRKNWSSVILWNLDHPANARLTVDMVNELPGRDLHRFCWLRDDEIGELPVEWNWLVGVDPETEADAGAKPKLLHYTHGTPELGIEGPYAAEWRAELEMMGAR